VHGPEREQFLDANVGARIDAPPVSVFPVSQPSTP
jgi:hypothetical protein